MHVRCATSEDCDAISRIASATFALACPPDTPYDELESYTREHLTAACFRSVLENSAQELRVVEEGGQVVGFSLLDHQPEPLEIAAADGITELTRCYVEVGQHGRGIAQALLGATLAGAGRVRLTVNDQNARAIAFYQRNGFRQVGETRFLCGTDIHRDLVMVREGQAVPS